MRITNTANVRMFWWGGVSLIACLLSFFIILPVQAQTTCCLSTSDPSQCRIEKPDEPCDTQLTSIEDCPAVSETSDGSEIAERDRCVQRATKGQKEKVVNCSEHQSCREATLAEVDCGIFNQSISECRQNATCFFFGDTCHNRYDAGVCGRITNQAYCGTTQGSQVCQWSDGRCLSKVEAQLSEQYKREGGFLPACAYAGNCRSVNDLLQVLISVVREAFKYIGSIAFIFFIYGGITTILSFGNPEKVKKGRDILVAAVVGIIISFSAYLLVDFLLNVLQVSAERGI